MILFKVVIVISLTFKGFFCSIMSAYFSSSPFFHIDDRRLEKGNRNCWLNLPQGRKASWKPPWMLVSFCVVDCLLLCLFPHVSIKVFTQFKKQRHAQKNPQASTTVVKQETLPSDDTFVCTC